MVRATDSIIMKKGLSKRRKTDVFDVQDLKLLQLLKKLRKIVGTTNPADAGTKSQSYESAPHARLRKIAEGRYTPDTRW